MIYFGPNGKTKSSGGLPLTPAVKQCPNTLTISFMISCFIKELVPGLTGKMILNPIYKDQLSLHDLKGAYSRLYPYQAILSRRWIAATN